MQNIILLNDAPIIQRPRPYRMILALQEEFKIHAISYSCAPNSTQKLEYGLLESVEFYNFDAPKRGKQRSQKEKEEIESNCKRGTFRPLIFTKNRKKIPEILNSISSKLIIVCDIVLLPFAVEYKLQKGGVKILIDLREFYPLQSEKREWLESFGRFFSHLCEEYLRYVDFSISVSEEICAKYARYGLKPELYLSLPPYFERPKASKIIVSKKFVNIIYHGFLSSDRNSQVLFELGNLIMRERLNFRIYVMGDSNEGGFMERAEISSQTGAIKLLEMVEMPKIVPFCSQFDIGILTLGDSNFNNAYALPNKLFEYIQSNLMVLSTPHKKIGQILKRYEVGVQSAKCSATSLLETLKSLNAQEIRGFKASSRKAAKELNLDVNAMKLKKWVSNLIQSSS